MREREREREREKEREKERGETDDRTKKEIREREESTFKMRYLIWLLISRVLKSLPTIFTIYCWTSYSDSSRLSMNHSTIRPDLPILDTLMVGAGTPT